ncbi:MAG: hypothetical protein Q8K83_05780 [Methylotenera sp.]|nr:hypothetical protein [Methylotenera sp.]
MKKLLSKSVLGIIGLASILWWFRYDYITAGQGFIFRVDHFTQTTSVSNAIDKEWENIEEWTAKPAPPAEPMDTEPAPPVNSD